MTAPKRRQFGQIRQYRTNEVQITLRVDSATRDLLKRSARAAGLTVNRYLNEMINQHVRPRK